MPKKEGGLGFRGLKGWNKAAMSRLYGPLLGRERYLMDRVDSHLLLRDNACGPCLFHPLRLGQSGRFSV